MASKVAAATAKRNQKKLLGGTPAKMPELL
jgi:hypothetical protein